jgi:thiol:disulfide interchange protein
MQFISSRLKRATSGAHFAPLFLCLTLLSPLAAQKLDPIHWTLTAAPETAARAALTLDATMDEGWHLYSMTTPAPPKKTTAKLNEGSIGELVELYQQTPVRKLDPNFGSETETYDRSARFVLMVKGQGEGPLSVEVRYQACNDTSCLPPRRKTVELAGVMKFGAPGTANPAPSDMENVALKEAAASTKAVTKDQPAPNAADAGLLQFLITAFGFGLLAVFTPCVFPMIPITMSQFLAQSEKGGSPLAMATLFCGGVIVLFTALGLALTALLGPFGAQTIASDPYVNAGIAAIFFALGLSLLGAFEITLPSGMLTKLNSASSGNGVVPTLLMGLTFSLTSFACVGPFVGSLLAASVSGNRLQPMLGMMSFAAGLSLPFFGLALFPSLLKSMPRSGGWLARVKIVMGFIIIAITFKYLASVDQTLQWNIITRERFLAIWAVLFAMPGLYLLGLLRMEGIKRDDVMGTGRALMGCAFLAFALSLVPGMFGARLGELDSWAPPAAEGSGLGSSASAGLTWKKNDLAAALAEAKSSGKHVFVNFTGYACTNCHWMKANMFPRPEIRAAMGEYVLVELYTDGLDEVSEVNQKRQEELFQSAAIPYYAIMDADGRLVTSFPGLTRKPEEFLDFLNKGKKS